MFADRLNVRYEFTNTAKLVKKVSKNRGKFSFSPAVCQRVCRLFLCRSHTNLSWQHEFADFSLPCEGRFSQIAGALVFRIEGRDSNQGHCIVFNFWPRHVLSQRFVPHRSINGRRGT